MSKVTEKQAEFVLQEVAKWLGKKMYENGEPAPTGKDAAYKGVGPELNMSWDWPGKPTPTVILESGYAPDEWAVACAYEIQQKIDAKRMKIYVEPYFSFALSIYPN
jgi:hypothetical protein